jgi:acetyltransferase-like isoleucine patch superfamily enzyme/glycosyltransferase involved in cell wall biosynthesis
MIDAMIITYNEALNLPHCLAALHGWVNRIFVIDSGSTDGTQEIARQFDAEVIHHDWEGYARQKNWALNHLPFESDWILIVDADEVIAEGVRERLEEIASRPVDEVVENGFFINRLTYFLGRPIRHCGYYPSWNLRFFKRGKGAYEDREVHEHIVIDDPTGYIREPMIHDDRRGLEHYVAKHNRYSTLEARAIFTAMSGQETRTREANITGATRRRRWIKRFIMPRVPFPGRWRFLYMYILQMGFLDGVAGLEFCRFISMYDDMVALKLQALRRQVRLRQRTDEEIEAAAAGARREGALAVPEGADPVAVPDAAPVPVPGPVTVNGDPTQMRPEASPWTFKEKVGRALWMLVGKPIFRVSFHNWYGFRAWLLRLFGARIGDGVAIRPTANIEVPWMIDVDEDATIGDFAILYSLGRITIGKRSIISQYAHLCAGTHDYTDHTFKLLRTPVTIGNDVWVGADAFIGPGVHVHDLSVVGARSSAYKELDASQVFVGNPARPVKERILR